MIDKEKLEKLLALFEEIESALIRFPSIDPASFRAQVEEICNEG